MPGSDPSAAAEALVVRLPDGRVTRFSRPFYIGRDATCELHLADTQVSRRHAEVAWQRGEWIIRDLQSSNGLFVDGARAETAAIGAGVSVRFGVDGPTLQIAPERAAAVAPPPDRPVGRDDSLEDYAQRYFGSDEDDSAGGRTLMIRKAYRQIQQQQKRRQRLMIALLASLGIVAAGYAFYQHRLLAQQQEVAEEFFYAMKDLDVRVAQLEQQAAASGAKVTGQQEAVVARRAQEKRYNEYVARLYDRRLNEQDRLILQVTRIFGECEIAAPPEYMREVHHYIDKWKKTDRFATAVKLSQERGYTPRIIAAFTAQGLPAQFYYLAMQESSFNAFASGPRTNWGYAKGMWQFIPDTAARYGLRVGPRASVPGTDVGDDRFNWEKETDAAARYVKDIYATDAQASGLLVIASYNWGERRVVNRLKTMPANPRERNFWQLLAHYRDDIPFQTYDYVFNIVAAAVIGENPRLFGIDLDSPLKSVQKQ
jgi:peptidoglycan lytic transglycosylase D